MKIIKINKDGYILGPYTMDADIELEVSDEDYAKVSSGHLDKRWRYLNNTFIEEDILDNKDILRDRRARECFRLLDSRSQMWYNRLTAEQKAELDAWYQAWLDVTETKIIPEKPEWLK